MTHRPSVTPARFLRYHRLWAQEVATRSQQPTDLYMDVDGTPHMTLEGWPQRGVLVGTFQPVRPPSRAVSTAPTAAAAAGESA